MILCTSTCDEYQCVNENWASFVFMLNIIPPVSVGLWGEGYHWRCRVFDKSTDATIASILIIRILPGQQVMVRSINSDKIYDSFYSFFIHSTIMQALSDMCATKSRAAGATIQPRGWLQTTQSHVYFLWRSSSEWKSAAGPHVAWAGRKY